MTQRNRVPVHVDITGVEHVEAAKGPKITRTRWDPAKGAREAQERAHRAVREEWEREQARLEADPSNQRFLKLEKQYEELAAGHKKLLKKLAELEAKQ